MHRNDWNTHSFEHEREKYNNKDKESPKNMYYVRETEAGERWNIPAQLYERCGSVLCLKEKQLSEIVKGRQGKSLID